MAGHPEIGRRMHTLPSWLPVIGHRFPGDLRREGCMNRGRIMARTNEERKRNSKEVNKYLIRHVSTEDKQPV